MDFPPPEASTQYLEHGFKLIEKFVAASHVSLANHPYLYHYREHKSVTESIVTKGKFWATHASFMSDSTELKYGASLVESVLKEFIELNPDMPWTMKEFIEMAMLHSNPYKNTFTEIIHPFFVCFSESGDIRSQWDEYAAKSTGYCIEFAVSPPYTDPTSEKSYALLRSNIQFLKVVYDVDEQKRLVVEALRDFVEMVSADLREYGLGAMAHGMDASIGLYQVLLYYVMCFKHPDFAPEQEWRCVYGMSNMRPRELEIKQRDLHGKPIPYVEMPLVSGSGPLVVKAVVEGVACTQGPVNFD